MGLSQTQLLAWIPELAPGPRLVICIEGTRSYGAGLARAAAAAGLPVIECEQPTRKTRRGNRSFLIFAALRGCDQARWRVRP